MANDILGQILGGILNRSGGQPSPLGNGPAGGLDGILGGLFGGRGSDQGTGAARGGLGSLGGGRGGTLMAMLLPLAMQWVQQNGGIGAVLQRFRQKGYADQANTWMSTGPNDPLPDHAVGDVVGLEELSRMSQQLGVDPSEVSAGMAQILPEVANHLSPEGHLPDDADDRLGGGMAALEDLLKQFRAR